MVIGTWPLGRRKRGPIIAAVGNLIGGISFVTVLSFGSGPPPSNKLIKEDVKEEVEQGLGRIPKFVVQTA